MENNHYREGLIDSERKSQDDYDKSIVSLSSGALGISILFIENIIGQKDVALLWALVTAWSLWAASIISVIISFFLSCNALREAINQADRDDFSGGVGGKAARVIPYLNLASGLLFVGGIIFIIIFASNNIR